MIRTFSLTPGYKEEARGVGHSWVTQNPAEIWLTAILGNPHSPSTHFCKLCCLGRHCNFTSSQSALLWLRLGREALLLTQSPGMPATQDLLRKADNLTVREKQSVQDIRPSRVVPHPNTNQTEICLGSKISPNWTHSDPEEHLFSRMQLLHFQWQLTVTSLIDSHEHVLVHLQYYLKLLQYQLRLLSAVMEVIN